MKSKLLLIITSFCCLILFSNESSAQEKLGVTFDLTDVSDSRIIDMAAHQSAIEKGDFNCFRFKTKRRTIFFESGAILTLYSATEILQGGNLPANNCFLEDDTEIKPMTFQIHESGIVVVIVSTESNFKSSK